ncbi:HAD family acid phosphatase [Amycolatopsis sp. CA-230715]|uniref:HAD family acid phosphatase n=1 Tax=Amycolatopsis sp. CA-230715 TaxID=2745196 RepID=UPI0020B20C10|nr:HAD family acid phosphatase [Amycolatopsis sp. CA-230715]
MKTIRIMVPVLAMAGALVVGTAPASAQPVPVRAEPSYQTWISDVEKVTGPANAYLDERLAKPGGKPALVFDIDNTTLETHYHFDLLTIPAIPPMLALAKRAKEHGASVFFVTGRPDILRDLTAGNLARVGYPVDGLYLRPTLSTEPLNVPKTRSRTEIEKNGYTIVANLGNSETDLIGGHAERTFKLPDYDGLLD